jgi:hypothetical protein
LDLLRLRNAPHRPDHRSERGEQIHNSRGL